MVDLGHILAVADGEAPAQIDHAQVQPGIAQVRKQAGYAGNGGFVRLGRELLAANVEGQTIRVQPQSTGLKHKITRGFDRGAKLA